MLIWNLDDAKGWVVDLNCWVCLLLWKKSMKTVYGCPGCQKGYHMNCFMLYRHRESLTGEFRILANIIQKAAEDNVDRQYIKKCTSVGNAMEITFGK